LVTIGGDALKIKAAKVRDLQYKAEIIDIESIKDGDAVFLTTVEDEVKFN
jgi:hypothetical protein